MAMELDIKVESRDRARVVVLTGSVDGVTAEGMQAALSAEMDGGHVRLVGDLAAVDYTSSAGLRVLLATVKQARSQGGDFRLAAVTPPVRRVLELSGFTSVLRVFDDVATAVASYA
jgi:anti-sigma B factor antagonist